MQGLWIISVVRTVHKRIGVLAWARKEKHKDAVDIDSIFFHARSMPTSTRCIWEIHQRVLTWAIKALNFPASLKCMDHTICWSAGHFFLLQQIYWYCSHTSTPAGQDSRNQQSKTRITKTGGRVWSLAIWSWAPSRCLIIDVAIKKRLSLSLSPSHFQHEWCQRPWHGFGWSWQAISQKCTWPNRRHYLSNFTNC